VEVWKKCENKQKINLKKLKNKNKNTKF